MNWPRGTLRKWFVVLACLALSIYIASAFIFSFHTVCFVLANSLCGTRTTTPRIMTKIMDEVCIALTTSTLFSKTHLHRVLSSAIACEVLARRVLHRAPLDRQNPVMTTRFRHTTWDGDNSDLTSALELAIDTHWSASNCSILRAFSLYLDVARFSCLRVKPRVVSLMSFLHSLTH